LSLSLLEAMACARPVVASAVPPGGCAAERRRCSGARGRVRRARGGDHRPLRPARAGPCGGWGGRRGGGTLGWRVWRDSPDREPARSTPLSIQLPINPAELDPEELSRALDLARRARVTESPPMPPGDTSPVVGHSTPTTGDRSTGWSRQRRPTDHRAT